MNITNGKIIEVATEDDNYSIAKFKRNSKGELEVTLYHLYIYCNEEPKLGDWYLLIDKSIVEGIPDAKTIMQLTKTRKRFLDMLKKNSSSTKAFKIIAATDPSLGLIIIPKHLVKNWTEDQFEDVTVRTTTSFSYI